MTELRWDGKYDAQQRRVAPVRVALPFQTVETVNESAQQRQRALDLFAAGRDPEWRNRLIWGDEGQRSSHGSRGWRRSTAPRRSGIR